MHLVDKVHPDLPVNLIFTASNQNTTPQVPGTITQVSADRLTDETFMTPRCFSPPATPCARGPGSA